MNILIVEDEIIQRKNLAAIIEKNFLDIRVYQATNIEEAIQQIEKVQIDLFFLDINLNGQSGLELATKIRTYDEHKLTGIVFITGEVVHIIEAFKKIHCYDFIMKPCKENEIKQIINVFFSSSSLKPKKEGKYTFIEIDTNLSVKLYHDEIIYIEFANKCNNIYTTNGVYKLKRASLSRLIKLLNDDKIVQTHRSFAINIEYLMEIQKQYDKIWHIKLSKCQQMVLMSNTYRQAVLGRLG